MSEMDSGDPGLTESGGTAMEDAISFLERAKKVYSEVSLLLNTVQLVALDFDPTKPFSESTVSGMQC